MQTVEIVKLSPEQLAFKRDCEARWLDSLRAMAADPSDPETQANALAILSARGIAVEAN